MSFRLYSTKYLKQISRITREYINYQNICFNLYDHLYFQYQSKYTLDIIDVQLLVLYLFDKFFNSSMTGSLLIAVDNF